MQNNLLKVIFLDGQSRTSSKGDTLSMSVLGKKGHGETAYEVPKDSLYFPSPYATTRVPGYVVEEGSECDSLRSSTRTPSDPQGSHTYDVPFPVRRVSEWKNTRINSPEQARRRKKNNLGLIMLM